MTETRLKMDTAPRPSRRCPPKCSADIADPETALSALVAVLAMWPGVRALGRGPRTTQARILMISTLPDLRDLHLGSRRCLIVDGERHPEGTGHGPNGRSTHRDVNPSVAAHSLIGRLWSALGFRPGRF